jgi:hypothetical protein
MRKLVLALILAGFTLGGTVAPALAMTVDPPEKAAPADPCIADPPPTNQGTLTAKPVSPAIGGACP